jgi:hypothetical protein
MRPPGKKTKVLIDFSQAEANQLSRMARETGVPRPTILRLLFQEFGSRMKIGITADAEPTA